MPGLTVVTVTSLQSYTMSDEVNNKVLDTYSMGWAKGDSKIIWEVLDSSYTFSGLPNLEPVDKQHFRMFWVNFRSDIQDGGGPSVASGQFMNFKNVVRRKVWNGVDILIRVDLKKLWDPSHFK